MIVRNKILTIFFVIIIFVSAFSTGVISNTGEMIGEVLEEIGDEATKTEWEKQLRENEALGILSLNQKVRDSLQSKNDEIASNFPLKNIMTEICGGTLRIVNNRGFYSDTDNFLYFTDDGYCIYKGEYTSCDYELDQIARFSEHLNSRGIKLLYVNEASKYDDDSYFLGQFGEASYLNDNMDRFLKGLEERNIEYLDLREKAKEQGIDIKSQFYRTDHHWTVPTSKWAASEIIKELNYDFHTNYDESIYDDDKYEFTEFKQSWIGEQGRMVSKSYVGMEDYTVVKPLFETNYAAVDSDGNASYMRFDDFIMTNVYLATGSPYTNTSWHYSYEIPYGADLYNNDATEGKVLVLGASYETCLVPFLSLSFDKTKFVCLRDTGYSAEEIVDMGDYDTVIMTYAQFMIGAHNREDNPNYNMFRLCK